MPLNLIILFTTIIGGSYLFLFEQDSDITTTLIALAPLSWLFFFLIRIFAQKKKDSEERELQDKETLPTKKKDFIDPDDYVKKERKI